MQTTNEVKKNVQEVPPSVRKDYEVAVDTFLLAEKAWKEAEEYVSSG